MAPTRLKLIANLASAVNLRNSCLKAVDPVWSHRDIANHLKPNECRQNADEDDDLRGVASGFGNNVTNRCGRHASLFAEALEALVASQEQRPLHLGVTDRR